MTEASKPRISIRLSEEFSEKVRGLIDGASGHVSESEIREHLRKRIEEDELETWVTAQVVEGLRSKGLKVRAEPIELGEVG